MPGAFAWSLPVRLGELGLGVLELGLQGALLGAVARLRLALDPLDDLERARRGAAAAQADQIVAAGQHLDRIGDKIAVVGGRDEHPLAEKLLLLQPEPVVEHVGIGDDDDVDRLGRLLHPLGRGGRLRRRRSGLALLGLGLGGLRRFRRAVGKGGLGRPGDVSGQDVALVVRLELGEQARDIGQPGQLFGRDLGRVGRCRDQRLDLSSWRLRSAR